MALTNSDAITTIEESLNSITISNSDFKNARINVDAICNSGITIIDNYGDLCDTLGIDKFESPKDLEEMCKKYPSLQIALEKFKTVYNLVKNDFDQEEK